MRQSLARLSRFGIVLLLTLLGAGSVIGNGGDDFGWMDFWRVFSKARAAHAAVKQVSHVSAATHFW